MASVAGAESVNVLSPSLRCIRSRSYRVRCSFDRSTWPGGTLRCCEAYFLGATAISKRSTLAPACSASTRSFEPGFALSAMPTNATHSSPSRITRTRSPPRCTRGGCSEAPRLFFSSRSRHANLQGDWSSDVCSSDLPEMGALARRWGVEQLGDLRGCTVWDLYGGIGDTASLLAGRAAQVVSVDVDEKAIEWARRRGVADGQSVRFIAAKAEDVLASLPEPQAVVCDPPRDG